MSDVKFTQLTEVNAVTPSDWIPIINISDTVMGPNGSNAIIRVGNLLDSVFANVSDGSILSSKIETSPTFTGNVTLPSTTTIGNITGTELEFLSGLRNNIQYQLDNPSFPPFGTLNVGPGTQTNAPLLIKAGTNTITPTSGAIEYDGTNLYFSDNTPTRQTVATKNYVDTSITNLIGTAPAILDTLGEIADSIADNGTYAVYVNTELAKKANLASPTFTGTITSANATADSLTSGAMWLKGASGAILLDSSAHKRISWNDGGGSFNIRCGNYHNGTNTVYAKAPSEADSGAALITLSTEAAAGTIDFKVAAVAPEGTTLSTFDASMRLGTDNFTVNGCNVGIGTSSPSARLTVVEANSSTPVDALRITQSGSGNALVVEDSTSPDNTPFVIANDGTVTTHSSIRMNTYTANEYSFNIIGQKARGTAAAPTPPLGGDDLIGLIGRGYDGAVFKDAAYILLESDGLVGQLASSLVKDIEYRIISVGTTDFTTFGAEDNNVGTTFVASQNGTSGDGNGVAVKTSGDMPGRITLSTSPEGSAAPVERMRINQAGNVGIGTSSPSAKLHVSGSVRIDDATQTHATATAGSNGDVPAQVLGYIQINLNGTAVKIPYYAV